MLMEGGCCGSYKTPLGPCYLHFRIGSVVQKNVIEPPPPPPFISNCLIRRKKKGQKGVAVWMEPHKIKERRRCMCGNNSEV